MFTKPRRQRSESWLHRISASSQFLRRSAFLAPSRPSATFLPSSMIIRVASSPVKLRRLKNYRRKYVQTSRDFQIWLLVLSFQEREGREQRKYWKSVRITHAGSWMVCKQYIVLNHLLSEKNSIIPKAISHKISCSISHNIFHRISCSISRRWLAYFENFLQSLPQNFLQDFPQKMHFWSQFLTDFHIWPTKSKLRTSSTRLKNGKKHVKNCLCWHFLPFLGPLEALKLYKNILSCRGGSKLQFGRSYVTIH